MRPLFFLLLLIACYGQVCAQAIRQDREQLYIKYYDGSIFIGDVVDRARYSLRIRLSTQDTITVDKGLIRRMRSSKDLMLFYGGKYQFKTGVYAMMTSGGGASGDHGTGQWDLSVVYRLKENLHLGGGFGFEGGTIEITGFWEDQHFTTFFGYGRFYPFGRTKIRPYVDGKLGYGVPRNQWDGEHSGGALIQPGIGLEFASKNNFRFLLSLSQYLQNTSGQNSEFGPFSQPVQSEYNIWYNRVLIKVGLQFK